MMGCFVNCVRDIELGKMAPLRVSDHLLYTLTFSLLTQSRVNADRED